MATVTCERCGLRPAVATVRRTVPGRGSTTQQLCEVCLAEVRASRARKRPIRRVSQRNRQASTRGHADQRGVDGSWLRQFHAGYSAPSMGVSPRPG